MAKLAGCGVSASCTGICASRSSPSRTVLAVFILALSMSAGVSEAAVATEAAAPILPLSDVRIGQHGYGLSVWQGSAPERFEAEVLGVMRNTSPETSYIVARLPARISRRAASSPV